MTWKGHMESWLFPALIAVVGLLAVAVLLAVIHLARPRPPSGAPPHQTSPQAETRRTGARASETREREPAHPVVSSDQPPSFYLLGLTGAWQGQRFPIGAQGLTLGRHPDNDVVLRDELMVSRYHAEIIPHDDGFVLRDLESANGTWVDDQRVMAHRLAPGNRIRVGNVVWLFADAAMLAAPLSQWLQATPSVAPATPMPQQDYTYFDGFWLEQLVGQGGMSRVYKARAADGQVVALKILQSTDPYLVQKFEAEGSQIGPLLQEHPHIVKVYAFRRSAAGHLYLVMDYVDGCSLRKRLAEGPLHQDEVVHIMGQACDALGYAHALNVVHRDVKPENILIQPDGQVKVVDFGIARLTSAMTVTGTKLVGTPEYMSPEQAKGEPVRPASDVYSLGIVLYEMLTGDVPFPLPPGDGNDWRAAMTVVDQHLHATPVPPRQRAPTVSGDLEQVVMKSLEKSWQKRYRDGSAVGQALGYRSGRPQRLPTPKPTPTDARLAVVTGPNVGQQWSLASVPLVIGRGDLNPDDLRISRRHLQIEWREGRFWLQDLSVNGTWVNQARVAGSVALQPGDLIAIGESVLQFQQ